MSQSPTRPMSTGAMVRSGGSAEREKRGPYIRPTQGLALRRSGGTMEVNLENIGGRILVLAERNTHKTRMQAIKPVVNVKPPWGHEKMKKRAASRENATRRMYEAQQQRVGTLMGQGTQGGSAVPKAIQREFDMKALGPDDTDIVNDFVALLGRMSSVDARNLSEQTLRRCEEQRLLDGYTGVFPELTDSEEENDHDPPSGRTTPPPAPQMEV